MAVSIESAKSLSDKLSTFKSSLSAEEAEGLDSILLVWENKTLKNDGADLLNTPSGAAVLEEINKIPSRATHSTNLGEPNSRLMVTPTTITLTTVTTITTTVASHPIIGCHIIEANTLES